jgi:hypothetical protein
MQLSNIRGICRDLENLMPSKHGLRGSFEA